METVRYYQRRGLMEVPAQPVGGQARSGMRRYGEGDSRRLSFIRAAQTAGFTLEEIDELIALDSTRDRTSLLRPTPAPSSTRHA